jgi:hypothetical protein
MKAMSFLERAARQAKVREPIIFATRRTGFIVGQDSREIMPEVDYQEWEDAIDEYFELKNLGADPFHIFTYLTAEEFDKFKHCVKLQKNILVIGFNAVRKCKSMKQEHEFFQYLLACSALNSYRTIYDMFDHRYDDDCLAILRGIYEQYLRIMGLRLQPNLADRFNALIYAYTGQWHYKIRKNGSVDYSVVIDPESQREIRVTLSNFALVSLSQFKFERVIYGELYNELSGHVHHDVTLWALKTLLNRDISLDRDQDKIRAIIFIIFISILFFRELSISNWMPKQGKRDIQFCAKVLTTNLLGFLQTENVRNNAGVPACVLPVLEFVHLEMSAQAS